MAAEERRPKWEVYSDEVGNMYFYNTVTGETTWELPPDDGDKAEVAEGDVVGETPSGDVVVANRMHDGDGNVLKLMVVRPKYSQYQIAVEVIEVALRLVDGVEEMADSEKKKKKKKHFVSPAAEARAKKNGANQAKKRKRERLLAMTRYMNILIPPVTTSSAATQLDGQQAVGTLFTREDAKRWRIEKEVQQIRQRYAVRKQKAKHRKEVYSLAHHQRFLKQFRTDLMTYFIKKIPCSSELQQQRVMLMSSPQQVAEMELQRRARLEPEMLERYDQEKRHTEDTLRKNVQKVFVLADHGAVGSIHLLQTLFALFSDERAQKYGAKVSVLAELINSAELQRFVVDFVSAHHSLECKVSLEDFLYFVQTLDEVLGHYKGVLTAVSEAETEIAAALEAAANKTSDSGSLLRARLSMVSKKKAEHDLAALQKTQEELDTKRKEELVARYQQSGEVSLIARKEEWEKQHHHRFIQIDNTLPVYCCLCRRRKWELWRCEKEEAENDFRAGYSTRYALKLKREELQLIEDLDKSCEVTTAAAVTTDPGGEVSPIFQPVDEIETTSTAHFEFKPQNDDEMTIYQIIRTMVTITERINSVHVAEQHPQPTQLRRPPRQLQTGSPKKKKKRSKKNALLGVANGGTDKEDELQQAMARFESEERERKTMNLEESAMHIMMERNRRLIERPLLLQEDAAHNAYIRLLSHCVNPCPLLYRLQFERCLSFHPPQHLVILMIDAAVSDPTKPHPGRFLVMQTVQCRNEQEASFISHQLKQMQQRVKSPFVAPIESYSKHTYQLFTESGMLVECWPVVFAITPHFPHGTWLHAFLQALRGGSFSSFDHAELQIIMSFRDIAAGLSAMHSSGILHLNLNLDNLYLVPPTDGQSDIDFVGGRYSLKIGGILSCKHGFDEGQLRRAEMVHCLNPRISPPELSTGQPISGKTDVWMLGCALYEALMLWQREKLVRHGIGLDAHASANPVIRLKSIPDVLQDIPLETSPSLRSLLRMLLQPNPCQRPQMTQVVDILSFARKKTSSASR